MPFYTHKKGWYIDLRSSIDWLTHVPPKWCPLRVLLAVRLSLAWKGRSGQRPNPRPPVAAKASLPSSRCSPPQACSRAAATRHRLMIGWWHLNWTLPDNQLIGLFHSPGWKFDPWSTTYLSLHSLPPQLPPSSSPSPQLSSFIPFLHTLFLLPSTLPCIPSSSLIPSPLFNWASRPIPSPWIA